MTRSKSNGQFISTKPASTFDARDQVIFAGFVLTVLVLFFG